MDDCKMNNTEQVSRFAFRGSWLENIGALPLEEMDDLLYAIMEYAFEGSYSNTPSNIDPFMQPIIYEIEAQKKRYRNAKIQGKKGGRPKKNKELMRLCLSNPTLSPDEIADLAGVSLRTVQRHLKTIVYSYNCQKQLPPSNRSRIFAQVEKLLENNLAFEHYRKRKKL